MLAFVGKELRPYYVNALRTSGGRSVGIVRSRTKGHGVCLFCFFLRNFPAFHVPCARYYNNVIKNPAAPVFLYICICIYIYIYSYMCVALFCHQLVLKNKSLAGLRPWDRLSL
jgi:hypothetical protein